MLRGSEGVEPKSEATCGVKELNGFCKSTIVARCGEGKVGVETCFGTPVTTTSTLPAFEFAVAELLDAVEEVEELVVVFNEEVFADVVADFCFGAERGNKGKVVTTGAGANPIEEVCWIGWIV